MWQINSDDVARTKERAQLRRSEIEAKYQEDLKALDAEVEAMETLERMAGEIAQKLAEPDKQDASASASTAAGSVGEAIASVRRSPSSL